MAIRTLTLRHGSREHRINVLDDGRVEVDGAELKVRLEPGGLVLVEGPAPRAAWTASAGDTRWVFFDGRTYEFEVQRQRGRRRGAGHHGSLMAPMPATVRRVATSPGRHVKRGDTLLILEAMKMELPVRATADGMVTAVHCREGDLVQPGISLIDIDEN
jgi:biotin carboxyl carrier protein